MKESSCLITKVRLIIVRRYAALDHSCRVRRDFDSTNHSDILDFVARARLCWSDLRLQHHVLFSARACVVRVLERGLSVLHQVFARWQSPNHLKNCFAFCAATCLPLAARDQELQVEHSTHSRLDSPSPSSFITMSFNQLMQLTTG
jgi:hypothetical protein